MLRSFCVVTRSIALHIATLEWEKAAKVRQRLVQGTRARHLRFQLLVNVWSPSVVLEPLDAQLQGVVFTTRLAPHVAEKPTKRHGA